MRWMQVPPGRSTRRIPACSWERSSGTCSSTFEAKTVSKLASSNGMRAPVVVRDWEDAVLGVVRGGQLDRGDVEPSPLELGGLAPGPRPDLQDARVRPEEPDDPLDLERAQVVEKVDGEHSLSDYPTWPAGVAGRLGTSGRPLAFDR